MRLSFMRLAYLLISAIFLQSVMFILSQPIAAQADQNASGLNDSRIDPILNSNGSLSSHFWVDEAGALVPMAQGHFILGADKWQKNKTFKMIVIGDSIAWGSGLEQKNKYYYRVADWLQKKLKRPVEVTVLAHTGATLAKPKDGENAGNKFVNPELSSWDPTLLEQVGNIGNPENVDLVLLSGGINDIDVNTILNPLTDPGEIRTRCMNIEDPLRTVLVRLLENCINSKIIVTSYYPMVSNDTTESALDVFIGELRSLAPNSTEGKGLDLIKNLFGGKQILLMMSRNSNIFDNQSRLILAKAVEKANQYSISHFKEKRVVFAPIDFPSNRSYGTNESWLWELTDPRVNDGKPINDERYNFRVSLCKNVSCDVNDIMNANGHPNVEGADEYNQTVTKCISEIL
ncbi:GDSL-like Lipase/Acylhydrolase family protein [uncultured archaeon]|nr:GDSL-like Lipase/Acylhydrolase family protein [uncultured archaeon]